jgi:exopolysaccharide production protein ExoZ
METRSQIRLENIQGLRAIAAMMVVSLHVFLLAQHYGDKSIMPVIAEAVRPLAHGGVDIFFVISGFIIAWVSHRAVGDTAPFSRGSLQAALTFALHRIARIYPLYWITLVAIFSLRTARGGVSPFEHLWANPGAIFLLSRPHGHSVAWTLVYEVHFYAIATVLILLSGRYIVRALSAWAVMHLAIVAGLMLAVGEPYGFLSSISMDLALGVLLGVAMILGWSYKAILIGWAALAAFVAAAVLLAGQLTYPYPLRVLVWAIPAMGVLYGLVVVETKFGLVLPAWLRRCGDWSYGIYLWHWAVLFGMGSVVLALKRKGTMAGGWGYVAGAILLTLILSALTYRYVERPIMRWVQHRRPSSAPIVRPATAET